MIKQLIIATALLSVSISAHAQNKKDSKQTTTKGKITLGSGVPANKVFTVKSAAKPVKLPAPQKNKQRINSKTLQKVEGYTMLPSGIQIKYITKGTGTYKGIIGDNVMMHIRVYVSDSMLFDSYKLNNNEAVPAAIVTPQFNGDIMEILPMLVAGDSVNLLVHQDSLYRNGMRPPYAKVGDWVKYQINLLSVKSKLEYLKEQDDVKEASLIVDKEKIDKYLEDQKLKNVSQTNTGLYYQITQQGTGENIAVGKEVSMNYTGYLLDGTVFDSNVKPEFSHVQPFNFTLGKGMVIPGWDQGIEKLKVGSKAKLIIPSALAYGNRAVSTIPANSVLVFDVEVLSTK